jgi:hypothetical protein
MRKVDSLSLIFIDFCVSTLIPRLNSTETSLQHSKNLTLFPVCRIYTGVISKETYIDTRCLGRILYTYMYTMYNVGDRKEPCGTPVYIFLGLGISPSTETLNFL